MPLGISFKDKMEDKKQKKNWIIPTISIVMIVIGVLFMFNKPIRNKVIAHKINQHQITKVPKKTLKQNQDAPATFDASDVEPISTDNIIGSQLSKPNKQSFLTVAGIAIPDLRINLPIYKGMDSTSLMYGAGTMKENQVLGHGNYALASHHVFGANGVGLLFSPLVNAQAGMKAYVTDTDKIFIYEITKKFEVEPSQGNVIDDTDEPTLTLVTCTDFHAQKRTIVQAKLIGEEPYATSSAKGAFSYNYSIPWW